MVQRILVLLVEAKRGAIERGNAGFAELMTFVMEVFGSFVMSFDIRVPRVRDGMMYQAVLGRHRGQSKAGEQKGSDELLSHGANLARVSHLR
jgi:hypothetical protein